MDSVSHHGVNTQHSQLQENRVIIERIDSFRRDPQTNIKLVNGLRRLAFAKCIRPNKDTPLNILPIELLESVTSYSPDSQNPE